MKGENILKLLNTRHFATMVTNEIIDGKNV
jgi:hypothetical protein